jgi:hypothetical protein
MPFLSSSISCPCCGTPIFFRWGSPDASVVTPAAERPFSIEGDQLILHCQDPICKTMKIVIPVRPKE